MLVAEMKGRLKVIQVETWDCRRFWTNGGLFCMTAPKPCCMRAPSESLVEFLGIIKTHRAREGRIRLFSCLFSLKIVERFLWRNVANLEQADTFGINMPVQLLIH